MRLGDKILLALLVLQMESTTNMILKGEAMSLFKCFVAKIDLSPVERRGNRVRLEIVLVSRFEVMFSKFV